MKITPISSPTNSAGATVNGQAPENSALSRAKAIAAGESPIKVSHSDTPQAKKPDVRTLKMATNASPERYQQEASAESAISDPAVQAQAAEETKPLDPQVAAIAKQRRALQVKEREIADREKALAAASKTDETGLIAKLKSNPLSVMQEHGVTYDQLTEAILADASGVNPEIKALREELKAVKDGLDKTLSEKDLAAEQAVLNDMRKEAESLSKEGDTYELVRETGSLPDVVDLIHRTYKETGEILEVSEALQLVEDELFNESMKIAQYKKIQSKFKPAEEPVQPQKQQKQFKTLTNRDSAIPPLSRKARALAAFNGTLKK